MAPMPDVPYEIKNVTNEEDKIIKKCLLGYTRKFIKCGENEYVMPGVFKKQAAKFIYNMEVRPDDVWVITFPRSGTTWTQELIWLVENNLNFNLAKEKPLYERFPMLEVTTQVPEIAHELIKANFMNLGNFQGLAEAVKRPSWEIVDEMPSPRFIKTHLPLSLLPPKLLSTARVVYVARDPRDVIVSYYYLHKMISKTLMRGTFNNFWEAFRRDLLPWTPIVAHTNEAWKQRFNPNMHFLFYEDLIKDLPKEIRRVCKFLHKDYTDEEIKHLAKHLSFDSLRKNKNVNNTTGEVTEGVQFIRKGYTRKFIKCGENEYVMPGVFKKQAAKFIYNMEVRPDDVWVITFPRSGTTWTQELIWLVENNLNFNLAKEKPLYERFPMLEVTTQVPEIAHELIKANFMNLGNFQGLAEAVKRPSWEIVDEMPSPRFIKTHLPLSLLPPKLLSTARVVYVARDPRDVIVSYYYLHKMISKTLMRGTFNNFWEAFRRDLLPWTPIVAHTNEAWKQRFNPNMHFLFYEDLIKDLPKEIRRVCKFLHKDYTDEEIKHLAKHLSFDSLRKNKNVNNTTGEVTEGVQFIRKGEAGGWRSNFDEEMTQQADEYLIERLKGLDLVYPSFANGETTHL